MSEQPTKEPKPTQKFAGINKQWQTIGGGTVPQQSTIAAKQQNVKATGEPPAEEMKRQTVYMPMRLAQRLKVHAALTGGDISGIITRLVETYLDETEANGLP